MDRWIHRLAIGWSNVYFDRMGLIQWDSGSVTLTLGISNCSLQNYFENRIPLFLHNFLQNSLQNHFELLLCIISFYSLNSNSLLTVWSSLSLSQQSTVTPNYSQSIKINLGPSWTIIPCIHRSILLYWRLSDF